MIRSKSRVSQFGEVFTPPRIVREMHDQLPISVWADPTLIYLEPSCGNGAFLVEIVTRRLFVGLSPHQVANTTFGVDILEDNVLDARKRLIDILGSSCGEIITQNIICGDFLELALIKELRDGVSQNNLVIFGNPPYQQQSEAQRSRTEAKEQAKPIYHLFVEAVIDNLNPRYLSFITPSKWMSGGMGLAKYRERMMQDRHIRLIRHFSNEREVFPEIVMKGGVSYFLWDREYNGKCNFNGVDRHLDDYDIIVTDNKAVSILNKVKSSHTSTFLDNKCSGRKPFGLSSNFNNWKDSGAVCYSKGNVKRFVERTDIFDKNQVLGLWKVCLSGATAEGNIKPNRKGTFSYISNFFIVEPEAICTETYIVVGAFNTQPEAENFISYMKTKFFRFMLGIRLTTQNTTKDNFSFVPDLSDYSHPWIDSDLYNKFSLVQEEITYIENKIKPA